MLTVLLFLLILSVLVVVHEFGHFICARRSGMRVFEFGWGFPPRAFGVYRDPRTKRVVWVWGRGRGSLSQTGGGEERSEEYPATLYSVNWLPLGGFVKIKGENGEEAAEPDSFGYQKTWKKIITLVAGVVMNFLLAAGLFGFGLMIGLPADVSVLEDKWARVVEEPRVLIQQVEKDSPADQAGLVFGDTIVSLDGERVGRSSEVIERVRSSADKTLTVGILRAGQEKTLEIKPSPLKGGEAPRLGVMLADAGIIRYPWYIAWYKGLVAAWFGLLNIFVSFYTLIRQLILGGGLAFSVSGPVGIAVVIGQSARLGLSYLINITAMISLSLAAINILPIPALDGGRVLFIAIERLTRRKVPLKYEQLAHTVGFLLLMALIIVVTWRDVRQLF
ncbi:MAG: Membrane-associated zinc metalloprotease [Candidatus Magasanikbacteria bacterium GW2011_GWA2_56_11]|uniref:Membrane-associated zinc metalloprotease n=1 Tax=Candidatus Magasanikbacteria bacterium GW2011_GWA2_56_11 TaxID=1619044 RepID=A0A0G1YIE5_9BACT|nr:MAG: Membrane-associated zinc metalloprotease [Candidatus Magasanikbacteria bacterium GW2011_GWA2_56_11]